MFDARELLNSLLGGEAANNVVNTVNNAMNTASSTASGAVQDGKQMADQAGSAVAGAIAQAGKQFEGTQAGDLLNKAAKMAGENTVATTAGLAGLAAVLLGTSAGRSVTGGALKVGSLGVLGGLAYKAFTNYQAGKPLTSGIPMLDDGTAPAATGFSPADHSHDSALVLLRTMIAAAAADGEVDAAEREKIACQVRAASLDASAASFMEGEMKSPATAAQIAAAVGSNMQLGVQAYMMARATAGKLSAPEQAFLQSLAQALKLDPSLVTNIDAAVAAQSA